MSQGHLFKAACPRCAARACLIEPGWGGDDDKIVPCYFCEGSGELEPARAEEVRAHVVAYDWTQHP